MGHFELAKVLVLALLVLESLAKEENQQGDKKHVVMYHPKPHQTGKCERHSFLVIINLTVKACATANR